MIILVEGRDGSGKSTVINRLARLGYKTFKLPRELSTDDMFEALRDASRDEILILDRSFITDTVYRMLDGNRPMTTMFGQARFFNNNNIRIILCDTDTAYEDSLTRGEDNITQKADSIVIREAYRHIVRFYEIMCGKRVKYYNWREHDFTEILDFIGNPRGNSVDIQEREEE